MNWYLEVLRKYAEFEGRARRKEYWMFILVNIIISIVLQVIDMVIISATGMQFGILGTLYSLAVLIPSIAVGVRRMHDINRSGWWILINIVPCIGWIVFIVFAVQEGTAGDNDFGPDPKQIGA